MKRAELLRYRQQQRQLVMERANGSCESCGKRTILEWDHTCGRRHIVSEPWASSTYLTVALCRGCHRFATDERMGVREFTRNLAARRLLELAKERGIEIKFDDQWQSLDKIRALVRHLDNG